jgi:ribonuclease VapC
MVIDTSVLLAIFFEEPHAQWASDCLQEHSKELCMSTVSVTETLILIRDRQPTIYRQLENRILESGIRFVPLDLVQAKIAAHARIKFRINLGDCFVYALAVSENMPILTLDADFKKVDRPVIRPK